MRFNILRLHLSITFFTWNSIYSSDFPSRLQFSIDRCIKRIAILAKQKNIFTFGEKPMFGNFGKSKGPLIDEAAYACKCVGETVGHLAQLTITMKTTNYL